MGKRGAQFAFLHLCILHFNITYSLLAKISFVSVSPFTTWSIIHKLSSFVVQNIISDPIESVCQLFQPPSLLLTLTSGTTDQAPCTHFRLRSRSDSIRLRIKTTRLRSSVLDMYEYYREYLERPVSQPLGELVSTDKFEALTNSTGRTSPKQGLWEFLVLPETNNLQKPYEKLATKANTQKSKHCSARYLHSPYSHTKGAFTARKQFLHNFYTTRSPSGACNFHTASVKRRFHK